MRIGVDVGGTNTDAVLIDGETVLASHKAPTSANVSDGIINAITNVLEQSSVSPDKILSVMVGTTHFTNAFVERKGLLEVAVIRLALPASRGLPPMIDWPEDIASTIGKQHYLVKGGYEFDGRHISELDEEAIATAAKEIKQKGLKAIAISCVFSPVNSAMEERAQEIVLNIIPDAEITISSRIGRIGLLERENAAIMNASLADLSSKVVESFRRALTELKISAPFFISQNDGTLMSADFVEKHPVLTFASGPTNSMRGAAYLSELKNALVVDIGGTTTDAGMLINGFPRESSVSVDIGGVRTNFRMPDILALGLGGGSLVKINGNVSVGPQSVGYQLTEKARVFGGDELTASDIAVAAGYAEMGDASKVVDLDETMLAAAVDAIHQIINVGVDRMKTSAEAIPVILVGGGAVLVRDKIPGTSEVIVPEHAAVANAIGASIAQVGGEVDKVFSYDNGGREVVIEGAKEEARQLAIKAGANPDSIEIIDFEELPLQYVPGNSVRLRAKAAGELILS
ncbi:MAG: hydantoinase/oxoprolinase family protein [Gammaproteobacteria bacterium]|nr:hydantoinase/oxoprolinase family protein [Gammaproteobacteria bacterium]